MGYTVEFYTNKEHETKTVSFEVDDGATVVAQALQIIADELSHTDVPFIIEDENGFSVATDEDFKNN